MIWTAELIDGPDLMAATFNAFYRTVAASCTLLQQQ